MFRRKKKPEITLQQDWDAELRDARELLLANPRVLRTKVKRLAAKGDKDPNAMALYTLAAGRRFSWTLDDWKAVLDKLDECELTVGEWLQPNKENSPNEM